ncbi:hypothetical protein AMATHDRAFT_135934 [Amanita thiersii Skay4041]|uniref:Mitochondrial outer membrane transport complex Sam37/metaxin N-terminal domain-containing protein n=1 Tax=Amanita thiersii Skay4041 TaxID=703135 RepID=A0A2A9P0Z9_9AGAR|nr:hypothetical protein AMATHDRAFT_135934 [Amanita thiersii Skay4041]
MTQTQADQVLLYIRPGSWDLPSIDPSCLAAVIYLQLTIPGNFSIFECSSPDLSPTGQLPTLIHDHHSVALLLPIIKYISGLDKRRNTGFANTDLDHGMCMVERSKQTAWFAHAETHLGNLVYYMQYSLHSNWVGMTYPAIALMLNVTQRYYIPHKIRDMYKPRLDAAGLWSLPEVETESKKPFRDITPVNEKAANTNVFLRAFEKEKAIDKAKLIFDMYSRILNNPYFLGRDSPSTLDVVVSAHILLLSRPPYPNPIIQQLLLDHYAPLITHAQQIFTQTLGISAPTIHKVTPPRVPWRNLLPSLPVSSKNHTRSADEKRYDRIRWSFFGLVAGCMATYLAIVGRNVEIKIVTIDNSKGQSEEEMEEEDAGDEAGVRAEEGETTQ